MRHDLIISARLTAVAGAALAMAACSSWMGGSEHQGSTSTAPAVTGQNSSVTTVGPPGSGDAPNPPTSHAQPTPK